MLRSLINGQQWLCRKFDGLLPADYQIDGNRHFLDSVVPAYLGENLTIVDVGGGKNPCLDREYKTLIGARLIGIDIDGDELAGAPEHVYDEVVCADIMQYRGNADADLVICQALLEHVPDVEAAFEAIASILKPGGRALLFVPSRNAVFARLNILLPQRVKKWLLHTIYPKTRRDQGFPAYYNKCTPKAFKRLGSANGLLLLDAHYYYISSYFSFFFPFYFLWRIWIVLFRSVRKEQAAETFAMVFEKPPQGSATLMVDSRPAKIALMANTSWYLWNFRRRLAEELASHGYELVWVAPQDKYSERLGAIGRFAGIELSRKGINPFVELAGIFNIVRVLRRERPDVVLSWTPKLNVYCGLVARISRWSLIPNVAGLGVVFVDSGLLARFVGILYRLAFARLDRVFFQNSDDCAAFVASGWVRPGAATILPGSGVDIRRFEATPPPANDLFVFLFAGRLIGDKGLPQLVEACRRLREEGRDFILRVYGHFDSGNPSGIDENQIKAWSDQGLIDYCGASDNIEAPLKRADCIVLPSFYREGIPRILLEAAASGRPVITTDSVGCREAVDNGVTGLLCTPKDVASLKSAMARMLDFSTDERAAMGRAARQLAETRFDENIVISAYLTAIRSLAMH